MAPGPRILLAVLSLYCLCYKTAESKTVVLLSVPHAANVRTFSNTGKYLAAMGHTVYLPLAEFMIKEKTVNTEGLNVIPFGETLGHVDNQIEEGVVKNFWNNQSMGVELARFMFGITDKIVNNILSDQRLISTLKAINPDLIVLQNLPPFRDIVVLPYLLDVPFAYLGPFKDYIGPRIPFSLTSTPTPINADFDENDMTFFKRFVNTMTHLVFMGIHEFTCSDKLVAKYAPNRPRISTKEIMLQAEINLVETDHIMDFAVPSLPNTKYVGSTAGNPPRPLKEPFKTFMNQPSSNTKGVVIVTFGSSIKEFPDYVSAKMLNAFEKLGMNVVFRINMKSPNPDKILLHNWIPQNDLLGHKNTKLFVSHCGTNGQYEAMYHAVPTLCLPMFGDMPYNAQRGFVKGFGLIADIRSVTEEELLALMKEMLENGKYKQSVYHASELYKELYKLPANETAYWLDHVMKYGGSYMRGASQNMPIYQFLALDVLGLIFLIGVIKVVFIYAICRCCCGMICKKSQKSKTE